MAVTEGELRRAAELIRAGELVAFPTETVYGLGANALSPEAVQKIYEAKGRPATSPLIVHVADIAMAKQVVSAWPETAERLAQRYWPGPLTLVLPKSSRIPSIVTAGLETVGVRVPDQRVALALIRTAGVPIAAPSANRFTQLSPTTAEHVRAGLGDAISLILDDGPTTVGIESTVLSLASPHPQLLRPGIIVREDLEAVIGPIEVSSFTPEIPASSHSSPGQHEKHYSPRTRFYLLEPGQPLPLGRGRVLQMPSDPHQYAAQLYATLHAADHEGWDWIAVHKPSTGPAWTGILDRLKRASAK